MSDLQFDPGYPKVASKHQNSRFWSQKVHNSRRHVPSPGPTKRVPTPKDWVTLRGDNFDKATLGQRAIWWTERPQLKIETWTSLDKASAPTHYLQSRTATWRLLPNAMTYDKSKEYPLWLRLKLNCSANPTPNTEFRCSFLKVDQKEWMRCSTNYWKTAVSWEGRHGKIVLIGGKVRKFPCWKSYCRPKSYARSWKQESRFAWQIRRAGHVLSCHGAPESD